MSKRGDISDLELAGLSEAELLELSEFIDPDVSSSMYMYLCAYSSSTLYLRIHVLVHVQCTMYMYFA